MESDDARAEASMNPGSPTPGSSEGIGTADAHLRGRATVSPPAPAMRKRAWWVRLVAAAAVVLTAWHIFASFLWIAPPSPLREVVPGNSLSSYMLPLFGQSWSVFAPAPINGDYRFEVRATLGGGAEGGGSGNETEWVSATDVELSMIRYNLFPPRAGIQSSELASEYKEAYDSLEVAQKDLVAGAFRGSDWEERMRAGLSAGAADSGAADAGGSESGADQSSEQASAEVDAYIAQDRLASAYATQVARAIWGDEVTAVQFRVSRQNVVPFRDRNDPDAQRPEPQMTDSGWREPLVMPGQNDENFARVFRAQYERIGG